MKLETPCLLTLCALALGACASSDEEETPPEMAAPAAGAEAMSPGGAGVLTWSFEAATASGLPAGFEAASGRWAQRQDAGAPAGSGVMAQEAESEPAAFNVLLGGAMARDMELSVRLRANEGEVDQGGGLIWRARDGRHYYIARWNPLENNFRVYKVVDGVRTQLASAEVMLDSGAWHELRVRAHGNSIGCELDGRLLLETHDDTFPGSGRIGLWTKADARTLFDDLRLNRGS